MGYIREGKVFQAVTATIRVIFHELTSNVTGTGGCPPVLPILVDKNIPPIVRQSFRQNHILDLLFNILATRGSNIKQLG